MDGEHEDPSVVDPQLTLLPQMVQMLQALREQDERGEAIGNRNQEIYKAKTQVEDVHAMKRALDEYSNDVYKKLLEKQQARIRGLFDSTSSLLSLNKPILRHLIGYLDEEALLSIEEASTTVKLYLVEDAAVELENRRKQQDPSSFFPIPLKQKAKKRDPTPIERAQSYRMAAVFARKMETLASQQYNYDQQAIEKPEPEEEEEASASGRPKNIARFKDMEICEGFGRISTPSFVLDQYGNGGDSVFVRLSYRTIVGQQQQSPLIWQGFVRHRKVSQFEEACVHDYWGYEDNDNENEYQAMIMSIKAQMQWPELREYKRLHHGGASNQEKAMQLERLATNLQVTVLLVPTTPGFDRGGRPSYLYSPDAPRGDGAYLLVATGGFNRCSGSTVYLKPRNKKLHATEWNPRNFLETSIEYNERKNELTLSITDDNPFEHDRYVERSTMG